MTEKVVAITGAYKGLGAELSELLAKKGYKLIIGGRDKKGLKSFSEKIGKLTPVEPIVVDVRNKKQCEEFVQAAVKKFGRLDILINNAGFLGKKIDFENIEENELRETFETNFFGAFFCSQEAVRLMKKQNSGLILNIGSTASVDYTTNNIGYAASKSALIGLTTCLRNDLSETEIQVKVFHPGGMKTDLFRKHQPERKTKDFMDTKYVAEKIFEFMETDEWSSALRRKE